MGPISFVTNIKIRLEFIFDLATYTSCSNPVFILILVGIKDSWARQNFKRAHQNLERSIRILNYFYLIGPRAPSNFCLGISLSSSSTYVVYRLLPVYFYLLYKKMVRCGEGVAYLRHLWLGYKNKPSLVGVSKKLTLFGGSTQKQTLFGRGTQKQILFGSIIS